MNGRAPGVYGAKEASTLLVLSAEWAPESLHEGRESELLGMWSGGGGVEAKAGIMECR